MVSITKQEIKDRCGELSYKYGERLWKKGNVQLAFLDQQITGTVRTTDDFHLTITYQQNKITNTTCSCPTLGSYSLDCQHIAAALIGIHETEKSETSAVSLTEKEFRHRGYFETRQPLSIDFYLRLPENTRQSALQIAIRINGILVKDIASFLEALRNRTDLRLAGNKSFSADFFYFEDAGYQILERLINIYEDQQMLGSDFSNNTSWITIPTTAWNQIEQLCTSAALISLYRNADKYHNKRLYFFDAMPPFSFRICQTKEHYSIEFKESSDTVFLLAYQLVYQKGSLYLLTEEEKQLVTVCDQLWKNQKQTTVVRKEQILSITARLERIGEVEDTAGILRNSTASLKTSVYIDRVHNRLLAGLEFQYGDKKITPFEKTTLVLRDREKETEIITFLEKYGFSNIDDSFILQNEQLEYDFLYRHLPELYKLAKVYVTNAVRNQISKKQFQPIVRVKHKRDRTNWLAFSFEIKGFWKQEVRQILEAIEEKRPYYLLKDGSFLTLETEEIKELEKFLSAVSLTPTEILHEVELSLKEGLSFAHRMEENGYLAEPQVFKAMLAEIQAPRQEAYPIAEEILPLLKAYQQDGVRWMLAVASAGLGGVLADEMGLGKTVQAIAFCVTQLQKRPKNKRPILIVCPTSLCYQWKQEWEIFAPHVSVVILDGAVKERKQKKKTAEHVDVWIISYGILKNEIDWIKKGNRMFETIIFDEAQTFKNPATQVFRIVKKLQAVHCFALTGTPLENKIEDLWSIFQVVFPELLGGLKDFSQLRMDQVLRRIHPFMLRREKKDVLQQLPSKKEYIERVALTEQEKKLYIAYLAKLRHPSYKHLDQETIRKNRIRILAGITRLRQICCHPALFVRDYPANSAKLRRLTELVKDAKRAGKRLLIFSQFTKMLVMIGQVLRNEDIHYFYMDGQTPSEERLQICRAFNQGENDICLISLKAGGTGLNLVGADTVILYDTWWNPAVEDQAIDRAHRIGQMDHVTVIRLLTEGTVEEKMYDLQQKKRKLMEQMVQTKGLWMDQLTDEDIEILLQDTPLL
ncbi:DEAD/DEAH box helicase [Gracilibacillus alcaliphilus]|uniref:DEAD/DEAH box helicase n=1 Tax=Gracilibacillus alcaliphilus TaxID=1401441 RepID=UPI00195CA3E3|nr:DEAD/DEAH box helicase [Gracilibacillus alcaliphilus]MBM7678895.1 SNF2 family DNA or RNA helicase [Gracilibacillus alcaliphilus]